jgi:arylsulfatase A-like enzyme
MVRGAWLALVLAVSACAPSSTSPPAARATSGTNIVLIVADDLGYGDVSFLGGDIPTPHIDALARDGVRLTSGYVAAPVCNPSRAALLTGRYSQRWGQELNTQTRIPRGDLPLSQTTLARALQRAGYATGAIGKWGLGTDAAHHPLARGFDEYFGHWPTTRYVEPGRPDVQRVSGFEPYLRDDLDRDRERVPREGYLTDEEACEAVAFIERHRREPFFLYAAFHAPHVPLEVTQQYYDRHPAFPHEKRVYAGMVSALDDAVGAILETLRATGLEERTLVIFLGDNGAADYVDFDGARNRPLSGHKGTLYEGGVRVPFVIRWKGQLAPGVVDAPVSALDVFPTVLAAAGLDASDLELDGVDLLPHLCGERSDPPHETLFWRAGPNVAARRERWKLLETGDGRARLYDLASDVGEDRNAAGEHPDIVAELQRALRSWQANLLPARTGKHTLETSHHGDAIVWHQ